MSKLKSNPIINALDRNEDAVQIEGYVGQSENGRVRLYAKLDLTAYFVVDASDIVHVIDAERDDEPARLFVRKSAEVEVVSKSKVKAVALRQKDDGKEGGGGGAMSCVDASFDFWWKCVQMPGSDIEMCNRFARVLDEICKTVIVSTPDTATR